METLFVGKNTIFLPEVDSTNSYAIDLLKNVNQPEGTVVHTANQTHGKGQRGASWNSQPQRNLAASFIFKPTFLDIKHHFFLYQVMALACYDVMAEIFRNSQLDIKIKWPNDILVNKQKIAGILIENNIQNSRIHWCVAGIGINVNQDVFDAEFRATSLKSIAGRSFDIVYVLELLCVFLEKYYLALLNGKFLEIGNMYLDHLHGLNEYLDFEVKGSRERLLVRGLNDTGLLVLEDLSGMRREVDVKEVKWML